MNFLKKVGIAAALFGAVTVANAAAPTLISETERQGTTGTTKTLTLEVTLPQVAKLTATKNGTAGLIGGSATGQSNTWFKKDVAASDLAVLGKIGTVLVEVVGIPAWDVQVASTNQNFLITTKDTKTLQCLDASVASDAKLKVFGCFDKKAAANATCAAAASGDPNEIKDLGIIGSTGSETSLASKLSTGGKFLQNQLLAATSATTNNLGTFILYAGVDCDWANILTTSPNDYLETLTFTLVAGW